jgi:predicted glycosyltransferase
MTRVLLYVTHLLGSGHLQRTALIAHALARAGATVRLVTGGRPIPHLDLSGLDVVRLPAVSSADEGFRTLVDARGRPIDEAWRRTRATALRDAVKDFAADALVLETYPFGRRQLAFEIEPLLDHAHARTHRPVILSSVRDILQAREPRRARAMVENAAARFDAVLVHGDPALVRLEDSMPETTILGTKVVYTGYVTATATAMATAHAEGNGEVIVSTGGGAVGERLLRAALAARARTALRDAPWRLIAGRDLSEARYAEIRAAAPLGVFVERAHAGFRDALARARLSVSQAGYNTSMDVLHARLPAVLVPYAGVGQTEQSLRAAKLAARRLAVVVDESTLDAVRLAAAIDEAAARGRPAPHGLDLGGAEESARRILALTRARRS